MVPPPSAALALTDHLLQLIIVPVDGPGQGARVLGHDGGTALGPPSNSLTSFVSSPRLSPPPTTAAATPPIASRIATDRTALGRGGHSAAERRRLEAPADLASWVLHVRHSRPSPGPGLVLYCSSDRSFAWAQPLCPALHPSPTHGPNFPFSLHLPTRSALTSPRRTLSASGPAPRSPSQVWLN